MKIVRLLLCLLITIYLGGGVAYADYTQQQLYALGIHYFDVNGDSSGGSCGDANLTGGDNETKIWNYLVAKGLSPAH